jgi:hypothetical protein
MIGVSNHGMIRWVPAVSRQWIEPSASVSAESGRTFGIDVFADTAYSPVLDRSVTTIDVEQGALEEQGAAADEDEPGNGGPETPGGAARKATATAGLRNGPGPVDVLLEWAAVRHGGWGVMGC